MPAQKKISGTSNKRRGRAKSPGDSVSRDGNRTKPKGDVTAFADAAECLKTLAHPVRLRVVQMLLHGRYTVGELAEDCDIADNAMSDHLRLLQRCRFLTSQREGRRVFYSVSEPHLQDLMGCIESRFLADAPE